MARLRSLWRACLALYRRRADRLLLLRQRGLHSSRGAWGDAHARADIGPTRHTDAYTCNSDYCNAYLRADAYADAGPDIDEHAYAHAMYVCSCASRDTRLPCPYGGLPRRF